MKKAVPKVEIVGSVQKTYPLYVTDAGVITCDSIVKIPLNYAVKVKTPANSRTSIILPVVEFTMPIKGVTFEIVTNEGTLVEPFNWSDFSTVQPFFEGEHTFFVLPKGSTGIKQIVVKSTRQGLKSAIDFGIMPPPYNYYNVAANIISDVVIYHANLIASNERKISDLDGRVDVLEDKTDNLKIVTHALNASYPYKELSKNSGKQTVNVEKGMLYFWTNFTYGTSPAIVHSPKITVSDGTIPHTYTLSLNKSVTVTIDLIAATITAYVNSTGEIVQQLKIFNTVTGYKTIEFENFDDIHDETLTLLITGRGVE